jgi:hypothetical protein
MFLTGITDPRMLEHAVKATMRVRAEIKGRRSDNASATEYELLGEASLVALQYLITAPLRAANFFHGPPFASIYCQ